MTSTLPNQKSALNPIVSWKDYLRFVWLLDAARSMGIHLSAGKGSGKSTIMGRIIAWQDFIRGTPQVIFDPHGPTIDNFLNKIMHLPPALQAKAWAKVIYVDMSGKTGYVVPFPLYYRLGDEGPYEISQRFLDVVRKIDPFLQTASVEGWNALWRTGTYTGMMLSALGLQITEAEQLLENPVAWENKFNWASAHQPDAGPAANFLRDLGRMDGKLRSRRVESFLNKIAIFSLDPSMRAMFGSALPGINWQEAITKGQTILFDFRHEHDVERRRFKMVWAFNYFLDFIKHREAGRHKPIGLIIDELTSLFSLQALAGDLFGSELDELINVIARNYSIWLTIAHQEMFQLTEQVMKSLMTMGTQILGVTSDPEAAKRMAEIYFTYDPFWVKKYIPTYASINGMPVIIDYTSEEFKLDEQIAIHSRKFMQQGRFQFLVKTALGEGSMLVNLRPVSIERFDQGIYPNDAALLETRQWLTSRNGISVDLILEDIAKRTERINSIKQLSTPGRKAARSKETGISFWDEDVLQ